MTRRIKKYNTRKKKSHKRVKRGGKAKNFSDWTLSKEMIICLGRFNIYDKKTLRDKLKKYENTDCAAILRKITDDELMQMRKYIGFSYKDKEKYIRHIEQHKPPKSSRKIRTPVTPAPTPFHSSSPSSSFPYSAHSSIFSSTNTQKTQGRRRDGQPRTHTPNIPQQPLYNLGHRQHYQQPRQQQPQAAEALARQRQQHQREAYLQQQRDEVVNQWFQKQQQHHQQEAEALARQRQSRDIGSRLEASIRAAEEALLARRQQQQQQEAEALARQRQSRDIGIRLEASRRAAEEALARQQQQRQEAEALTRQQQQQEAEALTRQQQQQEAEALTQQRLNAEKQELLTRQQQLLSEKAELMAQREQLHIQQAQLEEEADRIVEDERQQRLQQRDEAAAAEAAAAEASEAEAERVRRIEEAERVRRIEEAERVRRIEEEAQLHQRRLKEKELSRAPQWVRNPNPQPRKESQGVMFTNVPNQSSRQGIATLQYLTPLQRSYLASDPHQGINQPTSPPKAAAAAAARRHELVFTDAEENKARLDAEEALRAMFISHNPDVNSLLENVWRRPKDKKQEEADMSKSKKASSRRHLSQAKTRRIKNRTQGMPDDSTSESHSEGDLDSVHSGASVISMGDKDASPLGMKLSDVPIVDFSSSEKSSSGSVNALVAGIKQRRERRERRNKKASKDSHPTPDREYRVTIQYSILNRPLQIKKGVVLKINDNKVSITIDGVDAELSTETLIELNFNIMYSKGMNSECRDNAKTSVPRPGSDNFSLSKCLRVTSENMSLSPLVPTSITLPFVINFISIDECDEFMNKVKYIRDSALALYKSINDDNVFGSDASSINLSPLNSDSLLFRSGPRLASMASGILNSDSSSVGGKLSKRKRPTRKTRGNIRKINRKHKHQRTKRY